MTTNTITAAARSRFLRRPWQKANIGPANPFALYMAKNHKTVADLPFNKRSASLAKVYYNQSPAAMATLKATAKTNGDTRKTFRDRVRRATAYGLFNKENKALYVTLGLKGASREVATKWAYLSDAQKVVYAEKAAARNAAVERFIRSNI